MEILDDNVSQRIADYLAGQSDIRLGILFGSLSGGLPTRDSDLDLAVLGNRPLSAERRTNLIDDLARLIGRPVDLVDLATAGIPVARSAVLGGKMVYHRDANAYPAQLSRVLLDSADFLPYRNRLLKERREAWIRS